MRRASVCAVPSIRRPLKWGRRGFTLAEVLIAMAILSIAASAIFLGVESSLMGTTAAVELTTAEGISAQLLEEIAAVGHHEPGGSSHGALGPEPGESQGTSRAAFDDMDDYNGYTSQPPADRWGVPLGSDDGAGGLREQAAQLHAGQLANWQQHVVVEYLDENDLSTPTAGASDYRRVHVRVLLVDPVHGTRDLAHVSRVFTYVPAW